MVSEGFGVCLSAPKSPAKHYPSTLSPWPRIFLPCDMGFFSRKSPPFKLTPAHIRKTRKERPFTLPADSLFNAWFATFRLTATYDH